MFTNKFKFVDLSHVIDENISIFPSIPLPKITSFLSHSKSKLTGRYKNCTCELTKIEFVTSVGTYIDSPFHFVPDGKDISELDLKDLVVNGLCLDYSKIKDKYINIDSANKFKLQNKALLIYTGWGKYWGKSEYMNHPYLSKDSAKLLVDKKVKLVGIDTLNIDNPDDPERPVHNILLGNNIFIIENLTNLNLLIKKEFTFFAVPPKIKKSATFPVRAFAVVKG